MLTLGTTFSLSYLAMSGGDKTKDQSPSLNASSKEEERYIQYDNCHFFALIHLFIAMRVIFAVLMFAWLMYDY